MNLFIFHCSNARKWNDIANFKIRTIHTKKNCVKCWITFSRFKFTVLWCDFDALFEIETMGLHFFCFKFQLNFKLKDRSYPHSTRVVLCVDFIGNMLNITKTCKGKARIRIKFVSPLITRLDEVELWSQLKHRCNLLTQFVDTWKFDVSNVNELHKIKLKQITFSSITDSSLQ